MGEIDNGFRRSEPSMLLVSERRQLTNEHVATMFGHDYQKLVKDKAAEFGISDLQFFDSPQPHEGSQAVYLVEQFVGDDLVLVAVLEEKQETSKHLHVGPMKKERYVHVKGRSTVFMNGQKHPLDEENGLIDVLIDVFHQVKTEESPSLTVIIMENARLVAPGRLHVKLP